MTSFIRAQEFHYDKQTLLQEHSVLFQKIHSSPIPSTFTFSLNSPNANDNLVELPTLTFVELNKFQAIKIVDLSPGKMNPGKIIYSTIISEIVDAEAILFIIEDEFENACRVSVHAMVNKLQFKRGVSLVILNPFYQMVSDGKHSLVIKDPSNLSLLKLKGIAKPADPIYYFGNKPEQNKAPLDRGYSSESKSKLQVADSFNLLTETSNVIKKNIPQNPVLDTSPIKEFDSRFRLISPNPCQEFVELGLKMFSENRFFQAIVHFTCAIQANPYDVKLYEYRGMSYHKLEYFEDALIDFEKAKSLQPDNVTYQYLVAKISSLIGDHVSSLDLLKKIKPKENSDCLAVKRLLSKVEIFVKNINGEFDFEKLKECFNEGKEIEIGDFVGPVHIRPSPKNTKGMFATRDVKKGENLCVTKAINSSYGLLTPCLCTNCRIRNLKNDGIAKNLFVLFFMDTLSKSKLLTICFFSAFDPSQKNIDVNIFSHSGYELSKNIDTSHFSLEKVPALIRNIYVYHDHYKLDMSVLYNTPPCIWFLPSLINHSCIPNAVKLYIGDICIVRALTDIPKGGEIFASFMPLVLFPNIHSRSKFLGFKCTCSLCVFERGFEHKEEISQLIQLQFELETLFPVECIAGQVKPDKNKKEKLNIKKWLSYKEKSFRLVKLLPFSAMKHQLVSVSFQSIMICLINESPNLTDAINLAVEAEPYFSELDPETYVKFWTLCNQKVKGHLDPDDIRFKLIQKKFNEVRKLFF